MLNFVEESWDTIKDKKGVFLAEAIIVVIYLLFMNSLNKFNTEVAILSNTFGNKFSQSFSVIEYGNGRAGGFIFMGMFLTILLISVIAFFIKQISSSFSPIFMLVVSVLVFIFNLIFVFKVWNALSVPILGSVLTVFTIVAILVFIVLRYIK